MKQHALSLAAVAVAVVALVLGSLRAAPESQTFWITTRVIAVGSQIDPGVVRQVALSGPVPAGALPAGASTPAGKLTRSLPAGAIIVASDFRRGRTAKSATRDVEVAVPVGVLPDGLVPGSPAVVATWGGSAPPEVITKGALFVGASGPAGETTAVIAVPLPQAEAVLAALGAGKVAVLPWRP